MGVSDSAKAWARECWDRWAEGTHGSLLDVVAARFDIQRDHWIAAARPPLPEPVWSSEPPTESGWYWCKWLREPSRVEPVLVRDGVANPFGIPSPVFMDDDEARGFEWSGPIPMPKEVKHEARD